MCVICFIKWAWKDLKKGPVLRIKLLDTWLWQIHTSHAHAQGKFTDAFKIYWMHGCAFYWCMENLLDVWLSEFVHYMRTCLARRKQLDSTQISTLLSQSDCRDSPYLLLVFVELSNPCHSHVLVLILSLLNAGVELVHLPAPLVMLLKTKLEHLLTESHHLLPIGAQELRKVLSCLYSFNFN